MTALGPQFKWKCSNGRTLTLEQMDSKHMYNAMKMCFNHLAKIYNGKPVDFTKQWDGIAYYAYRMPEVLIRSVVIFMNELDRRKDLDPKYWESYQEIRRQILPLQLNSPEKLLT